MGCNCSKNRQVIVRWRLTRPDGRTSTHGTRRPAELADQRSGGGGTIAKVDG